MVVLYHYTNKSGIDGIVEDSCIRCTNKDLSKDACYGSGVYFTSLNPNDHDKDFIAKNNWSDGGSKRASQGHLDYYIQITFKDDDSALKCVGYHDKRNVYLYTESIYLRNYEWTWGKNSEWTPVQVAAAVGLGAIAVGGLALLGKYAYDKWNENSETKEEEKKEAEKKEEGNQNQGCAQQ